MKSFGKIHSESPNKIRSTHYYPILPTLLFAVSCSDSATFKGKVGLSGSQQANATGGPSGEQNPVQEKSASGEPLKTAGNSSGTSNTSTTTTTSRVASSASSSAPAPVCSYTRNVPDEIKTVGSIGTTLTALVVTDSGYGCDAGAVEVHLAKETIPVNLVLHSWSATNWKIYNPYNVEIKSIMVHSCAPVFRSGTAEVALSASTSTGYFGNVPAATVSTDPQICAWRRSWPKNEFWYSLTLRPDANQLIEALNSVLGNTNPINKLYYSSENFRHLEINSTAQNCSYYDPANICPPMPFTSTIFGDINHNGFDSNEVNLGHGEYKTK